MSRLSALILSSLALALLPGCNQGKPSTDDGVDYYPKLEMSTTRLDFSTVNWGETRSKEFTVTNGGDLAMGIESITSLEEMPNNFTISYSASDVTCPTSTATARGRTPDGGDTAAGDTAAGDTAATTDATSDSGPVVLDGGCSLPVTVTLSPANVGTILSSVLVTTYTETASSGSPSFYKDPDNASRVVILQGTGDKTRGNLVTTPTTIDFGQVYTSQNPTAYVTLRNVGTASLNLGAPSLGSDCDGGFSILDAFSDGRVLEPDTSALIEVEYAPTSDSRVRCDLTFTSDDADAGTVTVALQANLGSDTTNAPPTVLIRSPSDGYNINSLSPVEVEISVFDADQPASTLSCNIRSAVLTGGTLDDCSPADDSGHVFIPIDPTSLDVGTDTLVVTVKDGEGATASAGISIINRSDYPASDDDGDGYGDDDPTAADYDCDDEDINSFPYATEIYDGKDNDCDGVIDEGTEGGDDDEDGYSEAEGDCDDTNPDSYPGAGEIGDHLDNDCDGTVDEGTALYDDDTDGFTETEGDCNDNDPTINPGAVEICDGVDNDCNGLKDTQDGCISLDSDPIVVGGIQMGVTALAVGEATTMTVYAFDAQNQTLIYAWEQDPGLTTLGVNAIDNPTASAITFTAPGALPEGSNGEIYKVYAFVFDSDGNQALASGDITVLPQAVALERASTTTATGCAGSSSALLFPLLPALAAAGMARRRRRATG